MRKKLVLIRHAQAANAWGTPDIERPLTPKGYEQAKRLSGLLVRKHITFDALYVSTATRTQETAQTLSTDHPHATIHIRDNLYLPQLHTIDELRYELKHETCIGVVIHEPTVSQASAHYAKNPHNIGWGVDVATAIILTWEGSWEELKPGSATCEILTGSE